MTQIMNFKRMEVNGATKEEALAKAPFDIMGDATQAYKIWRKKQVNGVTDADKKEFMLEYLAKKSKNCAGVGFSITIESAVADTRERPYKIEDVKNDKGELKVEDRKILPGYVLVELQLPDVGWNSVLSKIVGINGVSGFLTADPTGKNPPKALSRDEHKKILIRKGEVPEEKTFRPKQEFKNGEEVLITSGPFASFNGTIDEVDLQKGRLRLSVQIFGRSTPVEVDFNQVEKVLS